MNIQKNYMDILNSIEGLLVVDKDEKVVFMCKKLIDDVGEESLEGVLGKNIRDILAHNDTYKVLQSKEKISANMYLTEGHVITCNSVPIIKNGEIAGALEYDIFRSSEEIVEFIDKINSTKGIEHFKGIKAFPQKAKYSIENIKGSSMSVFNLKREIEFAAKTSSHVLISGETGTGKELVAHAIHTGGQRCLFEFVEINCAAVPSELFESELFGYSEGSFTGAKKGGRKGLVETAHKGTLFLDEIDSLSLSMQAKLLRFMQEGEIKKVGENKSRNVDVRIIAATNKDLKKLVEEGDFREDLYYRIHVINIEASPLRQRKSDIPELVNNFIIELNQKLGRSIDLHTVKSIDNEALKVLMDYEWPGNVRQLKNTIERAMNHCYEEVLRLEHFQDDLTIDKTEADFSMFLASDTLLEMKEKLERSAIQRLVKQNKMSISKAAEVLGISRQMLHKKIKKYEIEVNVK